MEDQRKGMDNFPCLSYLSFVNATSCPRSLLKGDVAETFVALKHKSRNVIPALYFFTG